MIRVVVLLAAVTPPLVLLGYGIAKARGTWKSEAVWNALFLGGVGAIAAGAIEFGLSYVVPFDRTGSTAVAAANAIFAALPEESIKFFVLVSLAEKHVDVRRLQDILVIALAVSLGLATLENASYIIAKGDWQITAAGRAISSIPGHGIDGLAMGALLMAARQTRDRGVWRLRNALIVPVALHAAYDFPLFALPNDELMFGGLWVAALAVSSVFVIALCNLLLSAAVEFDRATGRDDESVETTDRLIAGGLAGAIGGPLLAIWAVNAEGHNNSIPIIVGMSIFPLALGIDAIRTGLKRRHPNPDKAPSEIGWV